MACLWQSDEHLTAIPDAALAEEGRRRFSAREAQRVYVKECEDKASRGEQRESPPNHDLRIWWKDDESGVWSWHKRVRLPGKEIPQWKMAKLNSQLKEQARKRPVDSDYRSAGNKTTITGTKDVYVRRLLEEGLAVFAGEDLPGDSIVVLYAGFMFGDSRLAKHNTCANDGNDHRLALRTTRASMHPSVAGIDGRFVHSPVAGDEVYNLPYYVNNGGGNLLNTRSCKLCNCKLEMEYTNYEEFDLDKLRVDDCYCPPGWPYSQRVRRSVFSFFLIVHYFVYYLSDICWDGGMLMFGCFPLLSVLLVSR
jgi:hypothetical protein